MLYLDIYEECDVMSSNRSEFLEMTIEKTGEDPYLSSEHSKFTPIQLNKIDPKKTLPYPEDEVLTQDYLKEKYKQAHETLILARGDSRPIEDILNPDVAGGFHPPVTQKALKPKEMDKVNTLNPHSHSI